ncbi:MAG: uncharacterized protein QOG54_2355 [Actinomycetota bacterium]|nr:uncharacterized protein [Actinomycetota bacterium]
MLVIGFLAGISSGLFGIGGGTVMVPLLVLWAGFDQHSAHATSLAGIVPLAAVGATVFATAGEIDLRLAGLLALGGIAGAPLGAKLMARSTERGLKVAFGALTIAIGALLVFR